MHKPKYIKVSDCIEKYFQGASNQWVIRSIESGEIPGRKIGNLYWVDEAAFLNSTGNTLADQVLNG